MMSEDGLVVGFCFAGRRDRMSIMLSYALALLDNKSMDRLDIWNFAWSLEDYQYVESLNELHPRIRIRHVGNDVSSRGSELAGIQIKELLANGYRNTNPEDVYIKIDDDVVFIDVQRFGSFVETIRREKSAFLVTANVINNDLRCSSFFATAQHLLFLRRRGIKLSLSVLLKPILTINWRDFFSLYRLIKDKNAILKPGNVSINFCGWRSSKWEPINYVFNMRPTGLRDEKVLSYHIPEMLGLRNHLEVKFKVVHYEFGGQKHLNPVILEGYRELLRQELGVNTEVNQES